MLYALANPAALGVLLASFLIGVTLHGWVQAVLANLLGDSEPKRLGRLTPDPRRHVDPFGAVAAAISGLGWTRPVDVPDRKRRTALLLITLSGPLVNLLLGVGLLALWRLLYGPLSFPAGGALLLQRGVALSDGAVGPALFLVGTSQLYLGALSLIPLPPLDGGRLLFGLCPRTAGWQRAEYYLVEQNVGIALLLALLIIPLGGAVPLLPQLLDTILSPVLNALVGG